MLLSDALDQLRGRFIRARMQAKIGGWSKVAADMGLTEPTVRKFLAGKNTNTETIRIIEAWVGQRELADEGTPGGKAHQGAQPRP